MVVAPRSGFRAARFLTRLEPRPPSQPRITRISIRVPPLREGGSPSRVFGLCSAAPQPRTQARFFRLALGFVLGRGRRPPLSRARSQPEGGDVRFPGAARAHRRRSVRAEGRSYDCASVVVWEPTAGRVVRLHRPCGPGQDVSLREATRAVALAGTRAAWLHLDGGNTLETTMNTATVAHPSPATIAFGASSEGGDGQFPGEPFGDHSLLVFSVENRCDADAVLNQGPGAPNQCPPGRKTGFVTGSTVWRLPGTERCPGAGYSTPPPSGALHCSRVATEDGELSVLALDGGRIVVQAESGLRLLSARGSVLQEFDVRARSAQLSGDRLAIRTADAVEVYDTTSGLRTARFPAASALRLQDLDHDILVTASGASVMLRRLGDGRTTSIRTGRIALAQLESSGLFVAGDRRVTFTSMRDVLRRLGS